MFRTKQDVDRHAANVLGRIKNEKEKNSRGYQIARLYFDVGEHEIAKRYLSSFLSVRETVPQAHKLMGNIYLKTGDKEKAMECYKRSLELDGSQKDLVIKICELCIEVSIDPERARFWLEKVESSCPGNDVIFRLREKISESSGGVDFLELENLITSELTQRPEDVSLRIKLLRLYLRSGRLVDAYNTAVQTDRTMAFTDSLDWYETLMDIYYAYKAENNCQGDTAFYTQLLHCLRAVVHLRLSYREAVASAEILHLFDLILQEAFQISKQQSEWTSFLNEMLGQFYFLCGTLLLKRAQKGTLAWKDVIPLASVCYLLSNSIDTIDPRLDWFVSAGKDKKRQCNHLLLISNFRKSQAGHTLHALGKGDTGTWSQKLRQQYCTPQGKEKVFDMLFTQPDMRAKKNISYLMKTQTFVDNALLFPTRFQLKAFDLGCHLLHPQSLTDLIWLALQRYSYKDKSQPYYGFSVFETLQFSTKNMATGGAESLCQLDTDVFLFAAVRCAALRRKELVLVGHTDPAQPDFLPLCLTKPLCTQEQADWWMAAYKFFTNAVRENFSKMRHLLQRGVETVRLLGSHGMSVNLVVHIARCLEVKAKELRGLGPEFSIKADETDLRAVYYWEKAVEMLDRLQKNQNAPALKHRLFIDDTDKDLDEISMKSLISEAQYAVGCASMKEKKYEDSIRIFEKLDNPYAAFNTAKIYMTLAEQEKSRDAPVGREQHQILLSKARDAIFLTMDLLKGDKKHELNRSIEQHLDDVESQLLCASEEEEPSQYLTPSTSRHEMDSTLDNSTQTERNKSPDTSVKFNLSEHSRHHIRPSPERLDAQVQSLAQTQQTLVKMVLARNDELVKLNSQLVEALRENREVITYLQTQFNMSQKFNLTGLSTPGSHISSPYQPPYPAPQGLPQAQYGYQMASPAPMAAFRPQSPCPRSRTNLMTHHGFVPKQDDVPEPEDDEENPYFIDGEYFEESLATHGQYFVPDSQLVQDWPYGHRAGVEGSSTVTYAPQNRHQVPQTGYFASSLRGQALQYGGQTNIPTCMPGPGYFSSQTMAGTAMTQTPSLVAAIIGKDSPQKIGQIQGQSELQRLIGQPAAQPQPATSLALAMGQKPSFTPGNFGAGVKTASTPMAKTGTPSTATQSQPVLFGQQPVIFGQMTQSGAPSLINKSSPSMSSPTVSTAEVACLFQGKATYTSKIGSKQEGIVKVFFLGQDKGGRVRMETMNTNQVILNHDINTLKVVAAFTAQLVSWKRPQPDGKGEETVNLNFDNADAAQKLKAVILKIQETTKKSVEPSPPKPAVQSLSPFSISQGTPTFKPTVAPNVPSLGQSQSSVSTSKSEETKDASKSQFGGFTFSTTPLIKPAEDKSKTSPSVKLKESQLKVTSPGATGGTSSTTQAKPFAGFTFTPTRPSSETTQTTSGVKGSGDCPTTSTSTFTLGQNNPMPSFSNLATNTTSREFSSSGTVAFANAGQTLFKKSPMKGEEEDDRVDEYEPNVDFKPVIDLPDLVEIKTGEEEEEKIFGERARLFRFDDDTSQWKERGVGEMKILHNKSLNRYRILMRREQVLKICANHSITKDIKLTAMASSDKAWCWSAADFAEETQKNETFAIKFKTSDLALKFKDCFESCQKAILTPPTKVPESIGSSEVAEKQEQKSLAEMFKPKSGSWNCPGCYCTNDKDMVKCPACSTMKPGFEEQKKSDTTKPGVAFTGFNIGQGIKFGGDSIGSSAGGFTFNKKSEDGSFNFGFPSPSVGGSIIPKSSPEPAARETPKMVPTETKSAHKDTSKSLAELFKPKEGSWECPGCYCRNDASHSKCPACQTPKPGSKPESTKTETVAFTGFKLGTGFNFSPKTSTPVVSKEEKNSDSKSSSGSLLAEMLQAKETPDTTSTEGFSFTPKSAGFVFGDTPKKDTAGGFNFGLAGDSTKKSGTSGFQFNLGKVSTPVKTKEGEKSEGGSPFQFSFNLSAAKSPQGTSSATSPRSPEGDYYVNKDGDDSHIYFEPIVSLPEKVDIKTGEEQEVTRFERRAKLFRFHDGEWKERGLGNMKILQHSESHRCRLLMRREQIHKVCCNHFISPELDLKPMAKAEGKAWVWFAQDFSEEDAKIEQFAIKFKTKEIADEFKKVFDAARLGNQSELERTESVASSTTTGADASGEAKEVNDTSEVEFLYKEEATEEQKALAKKFMLPESFYLYEKKPPCPGCIGCEDFDSSKAVTPSKPKSEGKTQQSRSAVAEPSVQASNTGVTESGSGSNLFGTATGPSFSTLAAQGDSLGFAFKKDESKPFHWTGAGQQLFGAVSSGGKGADDSDEVVASDDIEFKPIVDLPDLVEVKTGEEGWDTIYCQRSKLYRFVKEVNQWKERATGEMKILKQGDRYRLLMRRDQVYKVACNHLLSPTMKLEPMQTSETAWCWIAQDYAENEPKIEQFALRFKTEDLAKQFKTKFEECQKLMGMGDLNTNNSSCQKSSEHSSNPAVEEKEEESESGEESEEDSVVIFDKRATLSSFEDNEWKKLGLGDLRILYNEDLNGNNISMVTDEGQRICNHVICREHTVNLDKKHKACLWSPKDFTTDEPVRKHFRAQFSSLPAAEEFYKSFTEGVSLARDSELSEITSHEMETPVVFSRGDAISLQGKNS